MDMRLPLRRIKPWIIAYTLTTPSRGNAFLASLPPRLMRDTWLLFKPLL